MAISPPLDAIQPIVYLDTIVVKIRQDKKVINKAIYHALGVKPGRPQGIIRDVVIGE